MLCFCWSGYELYKMRGTYIKTSKYKIRNRRQSVGEGKSKIDGVFLSRQGSKVGSMKK